MTGLLDAEHLLHKIDHYYIFLFILKINKNMSTRYNPRPSQRPGSKEYVIRLTIIRDDNIPAELKLRCLDDFYRYGMLTEINRELYSQYLDNK